MEYSANAPAIVVTIAMTMARRGRSTKTDESMDSTLLHALRQRPRSYRRAGTDPLQTLHDDRLTSGQARGDHHIGAVLAGRLDAPDRGLAVLHDEHVDALLVGDQRSLWNQDLFIRGIALQIDPHQLAVDQPTVRIWDDSAHDDGVGRTIDRHVDEIDLAHLIVDRSVGKSNLDLDVLDVGRTFTLRGPQEFALAHRKGHIHRILADDGGEDTAVGPDDIALGQRRAPDLPGNRRDDVGVAEIDLGGLQVGLIGHDGALGLALRCDGFVQGFACADVLGVQLLLALAVLDRQLVLRLARFQCALGLLDRGLK